MHEWHESLLHERIAENDQKWEPETPCEGFLLLPAAHEDEVGQLHLKGA